MSTNVISGAEVIAAEIPAGDVAALACAQQTLQEITETAVAARERRPYLVEDLAVPAVQLAQQIARQLHDYDLDGAGVAVGGGDRPGPRYYYTAEVGWKSGRCGRRQRHRGLVFFLYVSVFQRIFFWDPRNPGSSWDLESPPALVFTELTSGDPDWCSDRLANASELAQWAKDAQPFLDRVLLCEHARTQHLRDGVAASTKTLNTLNL